MASTRSRSGPAARARMRTRGSSCSASRPRRGPAGSRARSERALRLRTGLRPRARISSRNLRGESRGGVLRHVVDDGTAGSRALVRGRGSDRGTGLVPGRRHAPGGEQVFSRADDGDYPPDGTAELCGTPAAWPEDFPNYPAGSTAEPAAGLDIGLGVNICEDTRLDGLDLIRDATPDIAWTGFPVDERGRCPRDPRTTGWLVAVDVTGDGQADASASPLELCADTGCSPLGASDLDADGDGELVVMTHFSIVTTSSSRSERSRVAIPSTRSWWPNPDTDPRGSSPARRS